MNGDITRATFDPQRHYSSVRMQQGRVQLDADWNEQLDITAHRVEAEARDVVGRRGGAPWHDAGLGIFATIGHMPAAQQAAAAQLNFRPGDLYISAGHFYLGGVLCENEKPVLASTQPDLPPDAAIVRANNNQVPLVPPPPAGVYLVYADVWTRHLTAVEAPHILETALGGPDTCTRSKTVWQVKLQRIGNVGAPVDCGSILLDWNENDAPSGRLSARAEPAAVSNEPCIVAPGAGYRRLENQLYRVEVHKSGSLGNATFKWSRDNGSVVTRWERKDGDDLTVASVGRDKTLGFAAGQWIELTNDGREQLGQSGTLVQLVKAEGTVLTIAPATATGSVNFDDFPGNPKVRRWDSAREIALEAPAANSGFLPLESGVEVKFTAGTYRSGDYWLIPARTATGDVEWPTDAAHAPLAQPPRGIRHQFCRLAIAQFDGGVWTVLSDCRELFPPLTEQISLDYVGGDGQEVRPDPTQPNQLLPLPRPIEVGVSRGKWPIPGARVLFKVTQGNGTVPGIGIVVTAGDGVASCPWQLDSTTPVQQVEAKLLSATGEIHLPVRFTARLSVAAQVAYEPKDCPTLAGITNVQDAIDKLCQASHGGCCVSVGKEGRFKTVEEAVKALLQKDVRDICLCLLPGDHESQGLQIGNQDNLPLHLRIAGCGGATRLILKEQFQLARLASFSLHSLTLNVNTLRTPIVLFHCAEVSVTDCRLIHTEALTKDALLIAVDAQRLQLHDSVVEQHLRTGQDRVRTLFENEPRLKAVFDAGSKSDLTVRATKLAATLAGEDLHGREHMAENLRASIERTARALSPRESEMARGLSEALATDGVTPKALAGRLIGLFEATSLASPGTAVVLAGTIGEASICRNQIVGTVSLQGFPTSGEWTVNDLKAIGILRANGKLTFGSSEGTLRLHANELTRLAVDESVLQQIKDLIRSDGGKIEGAIRTTYISENIFLDGGNQLVSPEVSIEANSFDRIQKGLVGTVISHSATIIGNRCPGEMIVNLTASFSLHEKLNILLAVQQF